MIIAPNTDHNVNIVREIFSFPHPVNEYAARMVAGMVLCLTGLILLFDIPWLIFFLAYGFLARVLTGPTLSPFGLLATKLFVPILGLNKPVAGPPKRFAQSIGLIFAVSSSILYYVLDMSTAAEVLLVILAFFAGLESIIGFCTGCFVFGDLMKLGLIPEDVCEKCNNLY